MLEFLNASNKTTNYNRIGQGDMYIKILFKGYNSKKKNLARPVTGHQSVKQDVHCPQSPLNRFEVNCQSGCQTLYYCELTTLHHDKPHGFYTLFLPLIYL